MKHIVKRIMVLFIAVLLTMPDYAFAEEPEIIVVADGEAFVFNDVVSEYVEPNVGEAEAGPGGEGEPQSQAEVPAATYRFSAGEEPVVELVFRDGEEIIPPEDPTAPEGEVFAGWFLEDGDLYSVVETGSFAPSRCLSSCTYPGAISCIIYHIYRAAIY